MQCLYERFKLFDLQDTGNGGLTDRDPLDAIFLLFGSFEGECDCINGAERKVVASFAFITDLKMVYEL